MAQCRRWLLLGISLGLAACTTSADKVRIVTEAHGSDFFSLGAPGVYKGGGKLRVGGRVCRLRRSTLLSPQAIRIEHLNSGGKVLDTAFAASPIINRTFDQSCRTYSTQVPWTIGENDTLRACFDHGHACTAATESKAVVAAPARP